jgi:hypothetical protein
MLGLLIETAGTEVGREVHATISDLVPHDHEFARAMLRLVQAMRDTGALEQNEAWHLLYWILDQMSDQWTETDAELVRLTAAMKAIERSHGLADDEYFHLDDAPADWLALSNAWDRRLNIIWAGEFTTLGEPEMARLVLTDELHEDPRLAHGRASLFRGGPPETMSAAPLSLRSEPEVKVRNKDIH